jgi:hydrogenase maturation factor
MVMAIGTAESKEPAAGMSVCELALLRAANNLFTKCDTLEYVTMTLLAGNEVDEESIRLSMISLEEALTGMGASLVHGDSRISEALSPDGTIVTITAIGFGRDSASEFEKISAGDSIVLTGYPGRYRAYNMAVTDKDLLQKQFPKSIIDSLNEVSVNEFSSQSACRIARQNNVSFIHDISFGGLYRALYNISEYAGLGVSIQHEAVPVMQEIIELSEFCNEDPYTWDSQGSVLIAASPDNAEELIKNLKAEGIVAADIGCFTSEKKKVIKYIHSEMERYINL